MRETRGDLAIIVIEMINPLRSTVPSEGETSSFYKKDLLIVVTNVYVFGVA